MKRENIRILVLTNGEHIIAEQQEKDDDGIKVDNPVSIMPDPTPQGRGKLLFIPHLQFTEMTSCIFPWHNIRHVLDEVKEGLRNNYAQQFGDGLAVPNKEIILG